MNQEEVDKIIAEAIAKDKEKSRSKWQKKKSGNNGIDTARKVLNWIFMIGFAIAVIVYFALPEERTLFFCLGFGSVAVKLAEFYLRFMF